MPARSLRPGRRPVAFLALEERPGLKKRADEVLKIVRLGYTPGNPVKFGDIWPKLSAPADAKQPTWSKTTTQRALKLLSRDGLVLKSASGWSPSASPLLAVEGLTSSIEQVLGTVRVMLGHPEWKGSKDEEFFRGELRLSVERDPADIAYHTGYWVRAIQERLIERASHLGISPPARWSRSRLLATQLAVQFVRGFFAPEIERAALPRHPLWPWNQVTRNPKVFADRRDILENPRRFADMLLVTAMEALGPEGYRNWLSDIPSLTRDPAVRGSPFASALRREAKRPIFQEFPRRRRNSKLDRNRG